MRLIGGDARNGLSRVFQMMLAPIKVSYVTMQGIMMIYTKRNSQFYFVHLVLVYIVLLRS